MTEHDGALAQAPLQRYESLASFYVADPRRIDSRERDMGLWWRDTLDGPLHRAAWVRETGELYLVRLGPAEQGGGEVEVLARVGDERRLDAALTGWQERCGEPLSLQWLRERAARMRRSAVRALAVRAFARAGAIVPAAASAMCALEV